MRIFTILAIACLTNLSATAVSAATSAVGCFNEHDTYKISGTLNTPFLVTGYDGATPTLSAPVDVTTVTYAVNVTPNCMVLYDARVRKVLHTF